MAEAFGELPRRTREALDARTAQRARRKAHAMDRARSEACQRLEVLARRVALVPIETVHRIASVPAPHQAVAADFREDRGRADRRHLLVAVDHGLEQERPVARSEE